MSMTANQPRGPLLGLKVLEFAGIGPGPHCAMLLADLGADVLRIERPGGAGYGNAVVDRGRSTLVADIRTPAGRAQCLAIADRADVLIEGMRPRVMERLGLGPEVLCARNPRLIYGRMTGWGQDGPLATAAGHDLNYIALTGALAAIGVPGSPPVPPLNLVGDYGGGSLYLAFGIVAALFERARSGRGQVIDAAIVDGVTSMMSIFTGLTQTGGISVERERSLLGGAAPYYRCYECADGQYVSVGPLEPQFHQLLLQAIGADPQTQQEQADPSRWPSQAAALAAIFRQRTRAEWTALLEGTDCCFAPVLTLAEAAQHRHLAARSSYFQWQGALHSAPAPRFSRTPGAVAPRDSGEEALRRWGVATAPL
jgi:alpha-methylacyl-CoA racemase